MLTPLINETEVPWLYDYKEKLENTPGITRKDAFKHIINKYGDEILKKDKGTWTESEANIMAEYYSQATRDKDTERLSAFYNGLMEEGYTEYTLTEEGNGHGTLYSYKTNDEKMNQILSRLDSETQGTEYYSLQRQYRQQGAYELVGYADEDLHVYHTEVSVEINENGEMVVTTLTTADGYAATEIDFSSFTMKDLKKEVDVEAMKNMDLTDEEIVSILSTIQTDEDILVAEKLSKISNTEEYLAFYDEFSLEKEEISDYMKYGMDLYSGYVFSHPAGQELCREIMEEYKSDITLDEALVGVQFIANPYIPIEYRNEMGSIVYGQKDKIQKDMDDYWTDSNNFNEGWWDDKAKADKALGCLFIEASMNNGLDVREMVFEPDTTGKSVHKIEGLQLLMLDRPPDGEFTDRLVNQIYSAYVRSGSTEMFDASTYLLDLDVVTTYYKNHDQYMKESVEGEKQALSMAVDFIPVVGEIKAGTEVISGKDIFTGYEYSDGERLFIGSCLFLSTSMKYIYSLDDGGRAVAEVSDDFNGFKFGDDAKKVSGSGAYKTSYAQSSEKTLISGDSWNQYFRGTYGYENVNFETAFNSPNDIINMPSKVTDMNPNGLFNYLQDNGLELNPLGQGANVGIPFNEGGGFNAHFRTSYGDSYIQYNPSSLHHDGMPYYKVSSGNVFEYTGVRTGTQRFFLNGQIIMGE